jgi:hypothetical protein
MDIGDQCDGAAKHADPGRDGRRAGTGNVVFAVAENGDLLWHRYDGTGVADPNGATGWHPNSGNPIGNGWQGFRQLYGGVSDEGGTIGRCDH